MHWPIGASGLCLPAGWIGAVKHRGCGCGWQRRAARQTCSPAAPSRLQRACLLSTKAGALHPAGSRRPRAGGRGQRGADATGQPPPRAINWGWGARGTASNAGGGYEARPPSHMLPDPEAAPPRYDLTPPIPARASLSSSSRLLTEPDVASRSDSTCTSSASRTHAILLLAVRRCAAAVWYVGQLTATLPSRRRMRLPALPHQGPGPSKRSTRSTAASQAPTRPRKAGSACAACGWTGGRGGRLPRQPAARGSTPLHARTAAARLGAHRRLWTPCCTLRVPACKTPALANL